LALRAANWSGLQSPIGGEVSRPITGETTYTLTCADLDGDSVSRSARVRIIPGWQET
jgi:hypothetical protein